MDREKQKAEGWGQYQFCKIVNVLEDIPYSKRAYAMMNMLNYKNPHVLKGQKNLEY